MTTENKLIALDTALRQAVSRGQFAESAGLLERYGLEVERFLEAGAGSPRQIRQWEQRTRGLYEWLTLMVRSSKARLEMDLEAARRVRRYSAPPPENTGRQVHA